MEKNMIKYIAYITLSVFIITLAGSSPLFSHGIHSTVIKGGMGIKATYADGSPVSDSDVSVYSPGKSEEKYTSGVTDSKGRFVFLPDKKGSWKINVDDGMGHMTRTAIEVNDVFEVGEIESGGVSLTQKIIMAICVLWGAIGTALFFKARKG